MSWYAKVAWQEGLFFRPQLFQQQDRYFEKYAHQRAAPLSPFFFGFTHYALDHEALALGKVVVKSAAGVFADGTGEAWTVAMAERARRDGIDPITAAHRMRAEETTVQIGPSTNPDYADAARDVSMAAPHRQDDSFEGLAHYRGVSSYSYYVGESSDEFFSARCEGRLNPVFECSYSMSITEGVVAQVDFVDFRLYGGGAYANRRLRFVREVVCRYLTRC